MGPAFLGVFVTLFVTLVSAENSYMFVSSDKIRPGLDLNVHGSLLKTPIKMPVDVTFEVFNTDTKGPSEPIAVAMHNFVDTNPATVVLQIPTTVSQGNYELRVTGSGGLTFKNTTRLTMSEKSSSVLIQTDKAIYKPGQTIHFRVFGVTADLMVVLDTIDIDVFDPEGNKIYQWKATAQQLRKMGGVYEGELLMSDSPLLGDWKMVVTLGKTKEEKPITVDEYVLPKFEVNLELPSFGRALDKEFVGKVKAEYTFGKPVKGRVTLRIKPKNERFSWSGGVRTKTSEEIEQQLELDGTGTATFSVLKAELEKVDRYLDRSYLIFDVNVTETLTGAMMSDTQDVQFFNDPFKMEFSDSLPKTFKPGMQYMAVLKVSQQDDKPPGKLPGKVKITPTYVFPLTTTTSTTTTTTTTTPAPVFGPNGEIMKLFQIKRIRPDIMPPWHWPRDDTQEQSPILFTIPPDGIVEIPIDTPISAKRITFRASYEKISSYHSVNKMYSPSDSYIQMRLLTSAPKAGDMVELGVTATDSQGKATYQVLSKANIVLSGQIDLSAGILTFPLTSAMAPKAKVVIFYIKPDGEIVTDGLSFNVEGIFENKVAITFNQTQAAPADMIKLLITADPGSKVNVLGVDRSVHLLKTGNDITQDQVKGELDLYDTGNNFGGGGGCGWFCWRMPMPYGGNDAKDIFNNAGVAVLTDALVHEYIEPPIMWMMDEEAPMMAFAGNAEFMAGEPGIPSIQELAPVETVRKHFPETWLWTKTEVAPGPWFSRRGRGGPVMMMAAPGMADGAGPMILEKSAGPPPAPAALAPVKTVRKHFPETWLWENTEVARGGPMMMMAVPAMANVRGPMILEKSVAPPPTPAALAPVKTVRKHFPETWLWENTEVAPMPMFRGGGRAFMSMAAPGGMAGPPPAPAALAPVKTVRKHFPETWLWENTEVAANGQAEIISKVPDTITSWVTTAFAINTKTGLGITEQPATLTTFLDFFVSLDLPYSVVKGEKVIVQANIFNYNKFPLLVYIRMKRNLEYQNIHITSYWTRPYSANVARFVKVMPGEPKAVFFPIIPQKIGKIDIEVTAQSVISSDGVKRQLIVEAEGTPQEYNTPILIDMKQATKFQQVVPITYPADTVDGSQRVRVTAIGDLMGPSVNGIENLLKMPYGCGEQNMLNLAPNIFIVLYLQVTKNLDAAIMAKSKGFMVKGYQKELTYQHNDGSFSAFGKNDPSGSMWLTAFVLKSFVQARSFIFVDDKLLVKVVDWIVRHQNANGTFQEPGRVLHKEMQGGSAAGERSLTSFVLVALLEAEAVTGVTSKIQKAKDLALRFIETDIQLLTEVYELAIGSYALQLAKSPSADAAWTKMLQIAKEDGGQLYWSKPSSEIPSTQPWLKRNGKAQDIEMTAYAMLTMALRADTVSGLKALKWLTGQRNPEGGFSSTQDTILALQALAEMASQIYSKDFDMTVSITGPANSGVDEKLVINAGNSLVLQTRELPSDIGEVTLSAIGRGLGLVEVAVFYNIIADNMKPSFYIKVTVLKESIDDFDVQVCTSWLEPGASQMAVIEIGAISGFQADKMSVTKHPLKKKVEDGDRKVNIYLDEITPTEVCLTVSMQRTGLVAQAQPAAVKVYSYYEPTKQVKTFYVPEALRKSDVCQVCKECQFCNSSKKPPFNG